MKDIKTEGKFSLNKQRPASVNITEIVELCINHMIEACDKDHNYVPHPGVTLGEDPPHFLHHRWSWTECTPYSLYGMIIARHLTGNDKGSDVINGQKRLLLSYFDNLDGFAYAPKSPWNDRYPMCVWDQAKVMLALIYWFQESKEEKLLVYINGIIDGLFKISYQEGVKRIFRPETVRYSAMKWFSAGSLIEPLVKAYEIIGNPKALQLAKGITYNYMDPQSGYFGKKGEFFGFFRSIAGIVNGMSQYAALSGEKEIIKRAKTIHDYAISKCTAYGSTPGEEPACSDMELNYSALSLIRAGYDEYWDQIDRFTRNQTVECQFLDKNEWVKEKASKTRLIKGKDMYEYFPDDLKILPYSDYDNVLNRSIGGFCWTSANEHIFLPGRLMICCSGNAMRNFQLIQENTIVKNEDIVSVNLHFNFENNVGEVISYEPYSGKVSVILKENENLRVRIPEYAVGDIIKGFEEGKKIDIKANGRYAYFGFAQKNMEYSLEYPLRKGIEEDTQYRMIPGGKENSEDAHSKKYQVQWRGNTVIKILPLSKEEKSVYKRSHMDTDGVPCKNFSYFISDTELKW